MELTDIQWRRREWEAPTHSSATEVWKAIYKSCKYDKTKLQENKRHQPCDSYVKLSSTASNWLQHYRFLFEELSELFIHILCISGSELIVEKDRFKGTAHYCSAVSPSEQSRTFRSSQMEPLLSDAPEYCSCDSMVLLLCCLCQVTMQFIVVSLSSMVQCTLPTSVFTLRGGINVLSNPLLQGEYWLQRT